MKPRMLLLSIGAAIAIAGLAPMPSLAQTSETGAVSPPPPDVSRIIIRRPTGNVVMPETFAAPVPPPAGEAGTEVEPEAEVAEDGTVEGEEAVGLEGLDGIEGQIIRGEAAGRRAERDFRRRQRSGRPHPPPRQLTRAGMAAGRTLRVRSRLDTGARGGGRLGRLSP